MPQHKTTSGNNRPMDAVTPQEARMASLMSYGRSQTSAWREAFDKPRTKTSNASARASEVANKPRMQGYLKALYRERKKSDLISDAEYMASLFTDAQAARDSENWTAVSSFQRLIGQATANLSETINMNDQRMTDEQLIEHLGAGNPDLAAMLERVIGGKGTFH